MTQPIRYHLRLKNTPAMRQFNALQEKDGAYLSRHGRLVGIRKAATFHDVRLAELCLRLWRERLQSRYGNAVSVEVEAGAHAGPRQAANELDAIVLIARARMGCLASNMRPTDDAIEAARGEVAAVVRQHQAFMGTP